jgi:hypothetical protein
MANVESTVEAATSRREQAMEGQSVQQNKSGSLLTTVPLTLLALGPATALAFFFGRHQQFYEDFAGGTSQLPVASVWLGQYTASPIFMLLTWLVVATGIYLISRKSLLSGVIAAIVLSAVTMTYSIIASYSPIFNLVNVVQ